ncbi:MAG TPA: alpha/beta fold hydrolase, partial [Candidatus Kryptonia bacterium]|nr:alpha/beta fold hydrolase [Candidatus Kryptonia bacterium]
LMGYSMGGRIAAGLLTHHPERFSSVVLAGVGGGIVGQRLGAESIARALEATDASTIDDASARAFRQFAELNRNDRLALAACMRGLGSGTVTADELRQARLPVLIVVGEDDSLVGNPRALVDLIPGSRLVIVPGRDHLTAVGDRRYKEAVLEFLATDAHR